MKKSTILILAFSLWTVLAHAQIDKRRITQKLSDQLTPMSLAQIKFTQDDQAQIQKILGNDYSAVLGPDGQLAVVKPKFINQIKATPKGGFASPPLNAENATFGAYEKWWVYKQSSKDILLGQLGQERFNQLKALMQKKGIEM